MIVIQMHFTSSNFEYLRVHVFKRILSIRLVMVISSNEQTLAHVCIGRNLEPVKSDTIAIILSIFAR